MSLHDVSKHDNRRLDPKTNASDTRAQRDAHGTISANYTTDATDLTTNRGLKGGFAQYALTVDTASFPSLTIANPGTGLWSNNSITLPLPHGLNYTPTIETYLTNVNNFIPTPFTFFNTGTGVATLSIRLYFATVDATNVYLTTQLTVYGIGDTAPSLPCKYYLKLQPPA